MMELKKLCEHYAFIPQTKELSKAIDNDTIRKIKPELIVTMGAGDIDRFVPQIETLLKS